MPLVEDVCSREVAEDIYMYIRDVSNFILKHTGRGGKMKTIKDIIHANGIDISIYTQDFENEFISLMEIA